MLSEAHLSNRVIPAVRGGRFATADIFSIVLEKTAARERISDAEALALFEGSDMESLAQIGRSMREARHGSKAFYTINRHINYSNICVLDCDFCAFGKRKREEGAYELTIPEMVENARASIAMGAREIHIVGGLHRLGNSRSISTCCGRCGRWTRR